MLAPQPSTLNPPPIYISPSPQPQGRRSTSRNQLASPSIPQSSMSSGGADETANSAAAAQQKQEPDTALAQLHAAVAQLNREIDDKSLIIHEVLGQGAYGELLVCGKGGLAAVVCSWCGAVDCWG